jgi:hypothetical protein
MADEYGRIQKQARADPGTAGDQGEENWASLFRDWLPPIYQIVTKGRILSPDGALSPQVDVLVLSPSYPKHLLDKKHFLAGGVLAAFECKTTLRAAHLMEAVQNAVAIRSHLPLRFGTPYRELFSPLYYGLLAHSHEWLSPTDKVGDHVLNLISEHDLAFVGHPREMLDLVCVADLGVWVLGKDTWRGPKTINKGKANAEEFWLTSGAQVWGPGGSAGTHYVRKVLPMEGTHSDSRFTPIGAALSHIMRRLAWEDPGLRGIASYFWNIRMEGSGPGYERRWDSAIYSATIREDVLNGTHIPPVVGQLWDSDQLWNEWAGYFL